MNQAGVLEFLSALGIHQHHVEGKWVQASCPLAFARHKHGTDHNPSFGILINDEGKSGYHCFSCGLKGRDLDDLLIELQHYHAGVNFAKARNVVEQEADIGYVPHEWDEGDEGKVFEAWPEWWLDRYPKAWHRHWSRQYLLSRGIGARTALALDLRFDEAKSMVGFPIRHSSGQLAGFRGRHIFEKRYHDYVWSGINNTALVLYGENWLDPLKPVVVVEGPFDLAAVYPHYHNVVAIFMASVNRRKTEALKTCCGVLCMTDNDLPGEQVFWHLRDAMPDTQRVLLPDQRKDPGEMTADEIRHALSSFIQLNQLDDLQPA